MNGKEVKFRTILRNALTPLPGANPGAFVEWGWTMTLGL